MSVRQRKKGLLAAGAGRQDRVAVQFERPVVDVDDGVSMHDQQCRDLDQHTGNHDAGRHLDGPGVEAGMKDMVGRNGDLGKRRGESLNCRTRSIAAALIAAI